MDAGFDEGVGFELGAGLDDEAPDGEGVDLSFALGLDVGLDRSVVLNEALPLVFEVEPQAGLDAEVEPADLGEPTFEFELADESALDPWLD